MVAAGVEVGVGAVALARGVVAVDGAVKVLLLRDPDVGGEDLDGERVARRLLGVGVQLGCAGVARGGHGHRQFTCGGEHTTDQSTVSDLDPVLLSVINTYTYQQQWNYQQQWKRQGHTRNKKYICQNP